MKVLLDTHVIIWALTDDSGLTKKAKELIADPNNTVYYSLVSLWEIAIKNIKAPEKCPYQEKVVAELCEKAGYFPLDIRLEHIIGLRTLCIKQGHELQNCDPFDRILLSQAKTEKMQFVSHDSNLANYDEKCIFLI